MGDLRQAVTARLDLQDRKLEVVEVARHRIARTLEDSMLLRFLSSFSRRLYCLELLSLEEDSWPVEEEPPSSGLFSCSTVSSSTSTGILSQDS